MPGEAKGEKALFKKDYIQGLVTEYVSKGLRVTPFLNKISTDADNYVFYTEDSSPEAAITSGVQDLPHVRAPGSELQIVRTTGMTPKAQPVLQTGFKYRVETEKMENSPYSVERYIQRLAYTIGRTLESDVVTQLAAKASASTASLTNSVWSTSTAIDEDIIKMQAAFYDDSLPFELNSIFYDVTNFKELRLFLRARDGAGVGFEDANEFEWLGARHMYGGSQMTHGTSLGMDRNAPPATVVYGREPGAYNPSVLQGMEGYAPIINVKVKQIDDEIPRMTEIYMAAKYTIAVEQPNGIQKQTGL
jgi:hypothetical protein